MLTVDSGSSLEFRKISRDAARQAFIEGLRPVPRVTVSEWADANRVLGTRSSAEPGAWRTERTPYLREIMDALSASSRVQRVVLMKGSQVGGTEVGNNWLGYIIDCNPGAIMLVMPSGPVLQRKSRQTLDALIDDTPALRAKVSARKGREPGNTTLMKVFPGGILALASAESPADLRSMAARYVFKDEIDGFPLDLPGEGDPAELADRAARTYRHQKKIFEVSTPTTEHQSRIAKAFQRTDRRYYEVPCPHCGKFQRIEWRRSDGRFGIAWDGRDDDDVGIDLEDLISDLEEGRRSAWMICEHCDERIEEHEKTKMLAAGEWVPEVPERGSIVRGYHLSALYSPFGMYSWTDVVAKFLKARGNPSLLKVWANQDLGEVWKEKGEAPAWELIYRRREKYPTGTVPVGGCVLTAGVDVQIDRIELEVVAWGPDWESWSVSYEVHLGDNSYPAGAVWAELDRLLLRTFPRADGGPDLKVAALAIDAGAFSQSVYRWVRKFGRTRRVHAIRGRVGIGSFLGMPKLIDLRVEGRRVTRGVRVWPVDSGVGKEDLYGRLAQDRPLEESDPFPPGYCHFPEYGQEWFKGLTSETLVRRRVKSGRIVHDWEVIPGRRNEPLDVRNYATAAATILGIDRWTRQDWDVARGLAPQSAPEPNRKQKPSRWRRRSRKRT